MNTNYNSNNLSRWLRQCLSVVCISAFLLVDLPGAHAQTAIRATSANTNSPLLRANGKIAFTSDRDGNREISVIGRGKSRQRGSRVGEKSRSHMVRGWLWRGCVFGSNEIKMKVE